MNRTESFTTSLTINIGNEYWSGKLSPPCLSSSDDPAAACCSTIAELHNPYVNPFEHRVKVLQERDRRKGAIVETPSISTQADASAVKAEQALVKQVAKPSKSSAIATSSSKLSNALRKSS